MTVFANSLEVSAKAQGCKVIAAFPDTCFTPPQTPPTPTGVPIPYPNFGMDSDLSSGTGTVKIGGKEVSQENNSNFSKCSGDEAGSAPKKGIVTSKNTGKVYAQKWSMDVKAEGKGVVRFSDIATTNHASNTGDGGTTQLVGQPNASVGNDSDLTECPCCGVQPAHPHQVDADGNMLPTISEQNYYRSGHGERVGRQQQDIADTQQQIADRENHIRRSGGRAEGALRPRINAMQAEIESLNETIEQLDNDLATLEGARGAADPCPNLHDPADEGCGTHFDRTGQPAVDRDALGFTPEFRQDFRERWDAAHGTDFASRVDEGGNNRINHMTPLAAGGCPVSDGNLIPHPALSSDCQAIDEIQSQFQL